MRKKRKSTKAGWRINGERIYHVKGKRKSQRKTYKTKTAAKRGMKKK